MRVSKLDSSTRRSGRKPIFPHRLKLKDERGVSLEKLVVIIDDVPEYGMRLAKYLNTGRTFPYRAVFFSTADEAKSYIKSDGVYAVLATESQEKAVLDVAVGTDVSLFWLSEAKDRGRSSVLYRYGSAKEIERRLAEPKETKKHVPIFGFFSPAGGSETEELSREIAEGLGESGKILYLSLFPFGIYGREYGDGMSEALYSVRQSEAEGDVLLRNVLQCGERMDWIGPVRWYTDLESITKEDMEALLCGRWQTTEYKAIFVAVGQFDKAGRTVLNCCDFVLVPVWETESGKRMQEEFRRQLKESGETKIYAGMLEFPVKEEVGLHLYEAVATAVKKGGEAIAGSNGGNTQTDTGAVGFVS